MSLDVYTSDGANAGTVIDNARFHHSAWDRGYPHRHCGMPLGMYQILKLPSNGRNPQQGFEATIWYGPATSLHQDKIFQVCCRNQCLDATTGIKNSSMAQVVQKHAMPVWIEPVLDDVPSACQLAREGKHGC